MADSRINLLTLSTSTASDDFFVTDGSANGTRRLSAFNPTIGGNATVTGTLTSNGSFAATGSMVSTYGTAPQLSITPSGGRPIRFNATLGNISIQGNSGGWYLGTYFLGSAGTHRGSIWAGGTDDTLDFISIGDGSFSEWLRTSSTKISIPLTTASTTTSTGALVVSGGLGLAGNLNMGGSLSVAGGNGISLDTTGSASVRFQDTGVSKWWIYKLSGDIHLYYRDMVNARMQAIMVPGASDTTASTDFYSNVVCKGTFYVSSSAAQVILGQASASQLTYLIRPAQAGGAIQMVQDSATANRWLSLGISDNVGVYSELMRVAGATGNILIPGTVVSTTTSSGALVVGNGTQGGLGVGGNINLGGSLNSTLPDGKIAVIGTGNTTGTKELVFQRADGGDSTVLGLTGSAYAGILTGLGNNEAYLYTSNAFAFRIFVGTAATNRFDFTNSQFKINATTSSANTSSGALVVSGGVGVGGNLNIGGQLDLNSGTAAAPSLKLNSTNNGIYYTGSNIVRIAANGAEAATFGATAATIVGSFQTAAPTGGTSAAWKLGTVATVTPTSPNRTIEVEINGVTYYLHAKTTNN